MIAPATLPAMTTLAVLPLDAEARTTWDRLFGAQHAFEHPVTLAVTVAVFTLLLLAWITTELLHRSGLIEGKLRAELILRCRSWLILVPLLIAPLLLGAAWTILGVGLLSLLCYREYARATGLFREKSVSLVVVLGILAILFAQFDHWYGLFVALMPLTIGTLAVVALLRDEPKGYIQRVALGVLGFSLFGTCLGHLGYLANDANYRPMLLLIFLSVELNDVFAFVVGKTLGKRKLIPNTSPNKTVAGAIGALLLTTLLVVGIGGWVFAGTALAHPAHLVVLGMLISVLGQCGDLMLSAIKRDLNIKDMAQTIPGHGGLLDRFDSVLLVAPAIFHYIHYVQGVGIDQAPRILTGG